MTQALAHRWRFFRAGGFDQVQLETPADLAALRGLDQKLWASLACPVNNLELDRRMLRIIVEHFDGGPVGVESLAASLSEERGTLEDVIEPYLIQQGFLVRTARGRMVTTKAYRHLGLKPKATPAPTDLFTESDDD